MDKEIDLIEIFKKLLRQWRLIVLAGAAAAVVGVFVALVSPVKFTASCVLVPQTGASKGGGQLGGLAAMAGIDLAGSQNSETLSPLIYPKILASVPFQKELMRTKVHLHGNDEPVALIDYFADTKKMKTLPAAAPAPNDGLERLTPRETATRNALLGRVGLAIDKTDGFISLSATMPTATAAAEVAEAAQTLLQSYVTRFKVEKEQATLDFIEGRVAEAKAEYETAQDALASARDRNRNVVTQTGQITLARKQNDYDLAYGVYSNLLQQREQARIKVKETTPVFTVIEPVTVPTVKSAPKRTMIVFMFGFVGAVLGCVVALVRPVHARKKY